MKNTLSILILCASISAGAISSSQMEAQQAAWKESVSFESGQNYTAAISSMKTYAYSKGDEYIASLRIAWLYYSSKDYKNAERYYQIAAKKGRGSISPLLGLLNTYEQEGDLDKQVKMCKAILVLDKENYTVLSKLGALSFTKKDYRTCKLVYAKLNESYPEDLASLSGYAWALVYNGDNKRALPHFTKLVSMSPDYEFAEKGYKLCGGK